MSDLHWKDLLARHHVAPDQSLLVVWVSQRIGAALAAAAFRLGVGPNALTLMGLGTMFAGCLPYASSESWGWAWTAVLWQLGFAFDCADGQLARATRGGSAFGGWLDVACDHLRQTAITMSVAFVLISGGVPLAASLLACGLLHAGFSVFLHTATSMKSGPARPLAPSGWKSSARMLLVNLLDTPLYLLLLCLLRPAPQLLAVYVAGQGAMLLLRAAAIARMRLRA